MFPVNCVMFFFSTFHIQDVIIIYGGSLIDGPVSSELWFFNITSLSWVQKDSSGSKSMEGHTAHMVNGSMLVFFGYNPTYGYVGWVQQYNICKWLGFF